MKLLGWLSKLIFSTVLISLISVVTAWSVVNMYVEELLRQFQIPAMGSKIQFSDFAARLSQELNIVKPRAGADASVPTPSPAGGTDAGAAGGDESAADAASGGTAGSASGLPGSDHNASSATDGASPSPAPDAAASAGADEDAVAVMGQVQSEEAQQRDLVMSTEAFAKKKEQLTSEDKMKIFSLVVAKLPQNEVQRLSVLLEDGITAEELKEVDQTLHKYLSEDEYKQLTDIIQKY